MAKFDVITLGIQAVDVLVRLPEQVHHDQKQFVSDLTIQGGAPMGSAAAGLGRLGFSTGVVVRLGEDTISNVAREQFRKDHVSLDLVVEDDPNVRPAIALVEIDPKTAARTVFVNIDNYGYLREQDIPVETIKNSRALLVDGYDLDAAEIGLKAAKESDCQTVLDFEAGDADRMRELLKLADHAILPLVCARNLTGEKDGEQATLALAKLTPGQAVVTDGVQGSWATVDGKVVHQPRFEVEAIDTTGCGDSYHAGYTAGLLMGWPLKLRMEFGAFLASIVATKVGGRAALPFKGDISKRHMRDDLSAELTQVIQEQGL